MAGVPGAHDQVALDRRRGHRKLLERWFGIGGRAVGWQALEDEQDVDERVPAEVTVGDQLGDQPFERDRVVRHGLQHGPPGRVQQLTDGAHPAEVHRQHDSVGEVAHYIVDLGSRSAGDRRTDEDAVLSAEPGQHQPVRREQHDERCRPHLGGAGPYPVGQCGVGQDHLASGGGLPFDGPGPVQGELQRLDLAQPLAPVRHLGRVGPAPARRPDRPVEVLELRSSGGRAVGQGREVAPGEVSGQQVGRPAVARYVVHGEHDDVLLRATDQPGAEQPPGRQLERSRGGLGHHRFPRPVGDGQPDGCGRQHPLSRHSALDQIPGPQGLVTLGQPVDRRPQRRQVQPPRCAQHERDDPFGASRGEGVEEPDPGLAGGELGGRAAVGAGDGGGPDTALQPSLEQPAARFDQVRLQGLGH